MNSKQHRRVIYKHMDKPHDIEVISCCLLHCSGLLQNSGKTRVPLCVCMNAHECTCVCMHASPKNPEKVEIAPYAIKFVVSTTYKKNSLVKDVHVAVVRVVIHFIAPFFIIINGLVKKV